MRKRSLLAAVAVLGLLPVLLTPAPAQAADGDGDGDGDGDIICKLVNDVTFSPGLQLVEQQTHIEYYVAYSDCTSTSHPEITSGSHSGSFVGPRGCLSVPPSASFDVNITWNTGQTSTVAGSANGYDIGGQTLHTITGPVADGLFEGSLFIEVITQVNPKLTQCLLPPGVTTQTGVGVVGIQ